MTRREFITDAAIAGAASVSLGAFAADGAKLDRDATMALFDAHRDETEARVSAGIEQNRKGDFSLRIVAADGRPFDRAHVRIKQLKHDFKYGANLFLLGEIGDERREAIYEEAYRRAFNCATLAFLCSDKGRALWCAEPVGVKIADGKIYTAFTTQSTSRTGSSPRWRGKRSCWKRGFANCQNGMRAACRCGRLPTSAS